MMTAFCSKLRARRSRSLLHAMLFVGSTPMTAASELLHYSSLVASCRNFGGHCYKKSLSDGLPIYYMGLKSNPVLEPEKVLLAYIRKFFEHRVPGNKINHVSVRKARYSIKSQVLLAIKVGL